MTSKINREKRMPFLSNVVETIIGIAIGQLLHLTYLSIKIGIFLIGLVHVIKYLLHYFGYDTQAIDQIVHYITCR